jgi:hypothetical protein
MVEQLARSAAELAAKQIGSRRIARKAIMLGLARGIWEVVSMPMERGCTRRAEGVVLWWAGPMAINYPGITRLKVERSPRRFSRMKP